MRGKDIYVGQCPICRGYARLEIDKDVTNDEYMVICEECLAEWKDPQSALRNVNGQRWFAKGEVRGATIEEIRALGWDEFIVNNEE